MRAMLMLPLVTAIEKLVLLVSGLLALTLQLCLISSAAMSVKPIKVKKKFSVRLLKGAQAQMRIMLLYR